jgi:hypothetical protein
MFNADRDLHHRAIPTFSSLSRAQSHGEVLLAKCEPCGGDIWRVAERFGWSHSKPPRARWIARPGSAHVDRFGDQELVGHLQEGASA